jgi:hypothetical protein
VVLYQSIYVQYFVWYANLPCHSVKYKVKRNGPFTYVEYRIHHLAEAAPAFAPYCPCCDWCARHNTVKFSFEVTGWR